jgi:hypothetical protein
LVALSVVLLTPSEAAVELGKVAATEPLWAGRFFALYAQARNSLNLYSRKQSMSMA